MTKKAAIDPVEAADAEVQRLHDREVEIWGDRRQRVAELLDLEQRTGRDVAAGGSVADAGRLLAEGQAGLTVLDRAADEVARQREAAVPAVWLAEAASEKASEASKRAEAAERAVRTRQLLADLRAHEGCDFAPAGRQPGDGGAAMAGVLVVYNRPRTAQLLDEAAEHGRKAGVLHHQELNLRAGGQVVATSIEDLIAAGLGDGRHVFPPLREIESWASKAEGDARKRLQRARDGFGEATPDPATAPPTWTLTWRGREIVVAESGVSFLGRAAARDDYFEMAQLGEHLDTTPVVAAPAAKVSRRADSDRAPFDTSPTPYEIAREAAATGKTVAEIAEQWGVPVPAQVEVL